MLLGGSFELLCEVLGEFVSGDGEVVFVPAAAGGGVKVHHRIRREG